MVQVKSLKLKHKYTCISCIEKEGGSPARDLSVTEYKKLSNKYAFDGDGKTPCPVCGGNDLRKLISVETSYIKGYGFLDTKGAKNDMDLHLMSNNADPYASSRSDTEKREVIGKLQKKQSRDKKTKTFRPS